MDPTRRNLLRLGGAAVAAAALLPARVARSSADDTRQAIASFTEGAEPIAGVVRLEAPEIADNGGSVPIRLSAEGARRIAVFASRNPNPRVATFTFGSHAVPTAATRIRLAESQDVIAVAAMADGRFRMASRSILVTAGGCG